MTETMMETIITELIVNGGDARGKALEAIRAARKGDFKKAESLMKESNESLAKAHEFQTTLIQEELNTDQKAARESNSTLLMIHAQDHLMDAMTIRDIAAEMIDLCRELHNSSDV